MIQREHAFQGIVDRFIDRVVLPPFWTTGINHENELTENARARARGRGVKPGVPDVYVAQGGHLSRSVWIELKWGKNPPSDAQISVHNQLRACGIFVATCRSIGGVLATLRAAGMILHTNADNLAVEYEARAEAAVHKAETRKPRTTSAPKQRLNAAGRRAAASYARLLP